MNQRSTKISSLLCIVLLATCFITMSTSSPSSATATSAVDSSKPDKAVHIVYMEKAEEEEAEAEAVHIRTLASVLGSEEAAKEALIYSYNTAVLGFSAMLTPDQVHQISKQPGVLQVVPSRTVQLHPGPGKLNLFN